MPVYVLAAGDTPMTKIGWAASDVPGRVATIQPGCWETLRILRVLDGTRLTEGWLHRRFAVSRVQREWFRFDPAMLTVEPPGLLVLVEQSGALGNAVGMELIRSQHGLMAKLALGLGLTRSAVASWSKIPGERLPDVERITGIPRYQLRPDICLPPTQRGA